MIECAIFLRESDDIDSKLWKKFSKQFFHYYRITILSYFGYDQGNYYLPRCKLNYPDFFVTVMFEMHKIGIFDCEIKQLAEMLHSAFYFTQKSETIRNWFYERISDYDEVLTFFSAFEKAGKLKK